MTRQTRKAKLKTQTRKASSNANAHLDDLLPIEALTKIFLSMRDSYEKQLSGRKRFGWIVVTHVSQYWRHTALDCGTLWSTIRTGVPSVTEWLKRAGGSNLTVDLNLGTVSEEAVLIIVLQKLAQIRSLSIQMPAKIDSQMDQRIWSHLQAISSNSAPVLEYFELQNQKPGSRLYFFRFFAESAPALRKFSLFGCSPKLPSPCFENLTTLTIYNPWPPVNKFGLLDQLGQMPCLEDLTLMRAIFPKEQSMDAIPNIPVTHLPQLKKLTFLGVSFNNDLDFLSRLSLSAKTLVRFISSMRTPDFSAFQRFIDTYTRTIQGPIKFKMLDVEWSDKVLNVDASTNPHSYSSPTLALELSGPWEEDIFPLSWGEELVRLPVDYLKFLDIECRIGKLAWAGLSQTCWNITYISVAGEAASEFIDYLFEDYLDTCPLDVKDHNDDSDLENDLTDQDSDLESSETDFTWDDPAFSFLKTLEIVEMDFQGCEPLVESLRRALQGRKNYADICVRDILITDCRNFDEQMLEELRKVANVDVE